MADLRELHQVVVRSIHSGLLTADLGGARPLRQRVRGRHPRPARSPSCAAGRCARSSARSCSSRPRCEARAAHRGPGAARDRLPPSRPATSVDLGVSVSPLATADPRNAGYLLVFQNLTEIKRLEREVRTKEKLAAVGEMAAHLAHEIRNPLGSISGSAQVLMAESNISAEQGRLLRHHHPRVASGSPTRSTSSSTRPGPSVATRGPVDVGPADQRGGHAAAQRARGGPDAHRRVRDGRGPARLPGRSRPDHPGLLEPQPQRAGGHAERRHAADPASPWTATRCCCPAGTRDAACAARSSAGCSSPSSRARPWGRAWASPSSTASCASTTATSACAASPGTGRKSRCACPW